MTTDRGFSIRLFAGEPHSCSYLPGRESLAHFVDPATMLNAERYAALLAHGFRRSGRFLYRPACPGCRACVPLRLPASRFKPDRSQRRCQASNRDLSLEVSPAHITEEHFDLYRRYLRARHPAGGMDEPTPDSCRDFLLADWCETRFIDLRLGDRLVATAVTDLAENAASAVYTFFDPEQSHRGLGSFAVTEQARLAETWILDYLYLGFWIEESPKMAYKTRFRPHERFLNGAWRPSREAD